MLGDLPPKLERDALQRIRRASHDFFADGGRSGESNLVDARMRDDRLAGLRSAGNNVDDARRKSSFHRQFPKTQRGQRSLLRGLQDNRVAASQRRSQLPRREQQREIPGNDKPDNTDRLAESIGKRRLERIHRFAVNLCRQPGVIAQNVDHHGHIDMARFKDRLAVVERLKLGNLFNILLDQVSELPNQPSAIAGGHACARPSSIFERFSRRSDRPIDVRRLASATCVRTSPVAGLMVSKFFEPSSH